MADNTDRCMVAAHICDHLALGHLLYETELMPESAAQLLDVTKAGPSTKTSSLPSAPSNGSGRQKACSCPRGMEPDPEFSPFLLGQEQEQEESPQMGMSP